MNKNYSIEMIQKTFLKNNPNQILMNLLKKCLEDNLSKLEKKDKEEINDLLMIKEKTNIIDNILLDLSKESNNFIISYLDYFI